MSSSCNECFIKLQQFNPNTRKRILLSIVTEIDFSKSNIKNLNRDELMELAYSLDWNGSWDCDEEGQRPITRNELIESITNLISHHN